MRFTIVMLLVFGSVAPAQLQAVAGPPVAPIGCPFVVAISNDTAVPQQVSACPFWIKDASGTIVAPGGCAAIVVTVNPGATLGWLQPQIDGTGNHLPPGPYTVELNVQGTISSVPVTVGGVEAAVALLGVPRIGTNRNLLFCSPADVGYPYAAAAAFSTGIVPTCAGNVPLALDPLLYFSLDPANGVFLNFTGILDSAGMSQAPSLNLPNIPALIGGSFVVDFIVMDPQSACLIRRIAAPLVITIV